MQIVFINYGAYCLSSGVHIHFITNEMIRTGHECTVVVPYLRGWEDQFGQRSYEIIDYNTFLARVDAGAYSANTVFHGWTPRDDVRKVTQLACQKLGARYYVHLEDNERDILEKKYHRPFAELVRDVSLGKHEIDPRVSHPVLHQSFIAKARGVSILMDRLAEFVPQGVPTQLIWPACENAFFKLGHEPMPQLRQQLGVPDGRLVIVYPGNLHEAVSKSIAPLYQALPLIDSMGVPVFLLRCAGHDHVQPCPEAGEIMARYGKHYPNALPSSLPAFLQVADILVQPGMADNFDEYRFPSKLPLFLASGRPVILARTNLGRFLEDGVNCRILEENSPEAIARHVVELAKNPGLARKIGLHGRIFARKNFSWQNTTKKLLDFYAATA